MNIPSILDDSAVGGARESDSRSRGSGDPVAGDGGGFASVLMGALVPPAAAHPVADAGRREEADHESPHPKGDAEPGAAAPAPATPGSAAGASSHGRAAAESPAGGSTDGAVTLDPAMGWTAVSGDAPVAPLDLNAVPAAPAAGGPSASQGPAAPGATQPGAGLPGTPGTKLPPDVVLVPASPALDKSALAPASRGTATSGPVTATATGATPGPARSGLTDRAHARANDPGVKPAGTDAAGPAGNDAASMLKDALAGDARAHEPVERLPETQWAAPPTKASGVAPRPSAQNTSAGAHDVGRNAVAAAAPQDGATGGGDAGKGDASRNGAPLLPEETAAIAKKGLADTATGRSDAGPQPAATAQAPPAARAEAAEAGTLPRRVLEQVLSQVNVKHLVPGTTEVTVRLNPESLGRVDIRLHLEGGRLTAQLAASTPEAREVLRQHLPELEKALAAGRGSLQSLNVEVGSRFEQRERPEPGRGGNSARPGGTRAQPEVKTAARPSRSEGTGGLDLYA